MDLPKTILVPTDFSACAQAALDYALKLAQRLDARVTILHAYTPPIAGWEGGWSLPADVVNELEAAARTQLEKCLSQARAVLASTSAVFYTGDPRDSVLKAAESTQVDLIIIGTHGRRGVSRALLGSVTESILRRAKCAVLAVRHPDDG